MNKCKRAVGYVRVSSSRQAEEGHSLNHQHQKIIQYANDYEFELEDVYEDAGISGYSDNKLIEYEQGNTRINLKRKGMIQLLHAIKHLKIDYILVTKSDRLGRDSNERAFLKRLCVKYNVEIIYIDQPGFRGASDDPMEQLIDAIFQALDQFYSMNLSMEVRKIHEDLARKGLYTGGKVPIGYKLKEVKITEKKSEKYYIVDEETAPTIRLIFKMYLDGYGYTAIANHLNEIKAPGIAFWKHANIMTILKNENYYTRVWNKSQSFQKAGTVKPKEEWIFAKEGEHETIISEEDFIRVQEIIKSKTKNTNRGNNLNEDRDYRGKGKYLLTGFIKCGNCGKTYTANRTTSKRSGTVNYYFTCPSNNSLPRGSKCSNNLNMAKLDFMVWQELCKYLSTDSLIDEIDKYLATKNEENRVLNQKLYGYQKEIKALKKEHDNIFKWIGKLDPDEDEELFEEYNEKLSKNRKARKELEYLIEDYGEPLQEDMKFPRNIKQIKGEWLFEEIYYNHLKFEVMVSIFEQLIDHIKATKINDKETQIDIYFKFNHPSVHQLVDFRAALNKKKLITKTRTKEEKEAVTSKIIGFISDLYLGIANRVPSPYIRFHRKSMKVKTLDI
ncbi:recombinase family protein [Lysinibacillus sp. NPDC098008]|uniref:recombinase family protein n=1 Tax=Lysinibacillus sp. NPDC098008 TaxID=3364146 RepID=UPI0037FFF3CB